MLLKPLADLPPLYPNLISQVPDGVEFVDEYGAITPVPAHDGTECFKFDDTLWTKADHFKVRVFVCFCVCGGVCCVESGGSM